MKKLLTWLFVLVLVAGAVVGVLWYRGEQAQAQQNENILRTGTVERGDLDITVATSGNVVANRSSDLRFKVPGKVISVTVEVSDHVVVGQPLAYLDTQDLERVIRKAELSLEQIQLNLDILTKPVDENDVRLAELSIQDAAQSLEVARISKEVAEAQSAQEVRVAQEIRDKTADANESYQEMLEEYGLPEAYGAGMNVSYIEAEGNVGITQVKGEKDIQQAQSQWMAAYYAYQQAIRNLDLLQAGPDEDQVRQLELQIEQARLGLVQARESLSNTVLLAPHDGVVASVNLAIGTAATGALPAITLLDDGEFFVDVTVDEVDVGKVDVGQPAVVTLDAYPDVPLQGEVVRIATLPTAASGVVAYRLRVRLELVGEVDVRDGMTANVVIHTQRLENVLLAPNWAVRTDQSTSEIYVYVYKGSEIPPQRVLVTTGAWNETTTQILSGLEEGTTVALVVEERNLLNMQGPPSTGR